MFSRNDREPFIVTDGDAGAPDDQYFRLEQGTGQRAGWFKLSSK
jgi:hypothetical protein